MARQARLALQAPTSATSVPRDARLYPPAGRATRGCDSGSGTLSSTTADPGRRRSSCGRGSPGGRPGGGWGPCVCRGGMEGGVLRGLEEETQWRLRPGGGERTQEDARLRNWVLLFSSAPTDAGLIVSATQWGFYHHCRLSNDIMI